MNVAFRAFAEHYPLVIRPDDLWTLFTFAFAKHVEKNAEQLRSRFVAHEGKKVLSVDLKFSAGGASSEQWEAEVFPEFSKQIREHIGDKTHAMVSDGFSTTTVTDKACFEITLMAAMKHYFSYKMCSLYGFVFLFRSD